MSASASFAARKEKILSALAVPVGDYTDLSPKGSIDAGIRTLIDEINAIEGLVTTSSCAGRISVFLEGRKRGAAGLAAGEGEGEGQRESHAGEGAVGGGGEAIAGPGGKGGGRWLYVNHDPVTEAELLATKGDGAKYESLLETFGFTEQSTGDVPSDASLVHFKFEPMILHILTASLSDAHTVLSAASAAGFRESGAVSLLPSSSSGSSDDNTASTPIVAVRSMGLGLDSVIGHTLSSGRLVALVDAPCLRALLAIGNARFATNAARIVRFRDTLLANYRPKRPDGWEEAEDRRARMRKEGLARQQAVLAHRVEKVAREGESSFSGALLDTVRAQSELSE